MLIGLKRLKPQRGNVLAKGKNRSEKKKNFSKGQWFFFWNFYEFHSKIKKKFGLSHRKNLIFLYVFMVFDFIRAEGDWMMGLKSYEFDWRKFN